MISKEDVVLWFRGLSGHKRIDVMCSLLNKCLPFELRFFGTCLEDLGKQQFNQMKDFEVRANNASDISELLVQCIISDTRTRQKLALYICLVHSLNTTCSSALYKTLSSIDISQIVPVTKGSDEKLLDELLLIFTIAVNHPVFSFEQKATLGNILLRLREEEERLHSTKLPDCLNADYVSSALNINSPKCSGTEPETSGGMTIIQGMSHNMPAGGMNYSGGAGMLGNYIPLGPPNYAYPIPQLHQPPYLWHVVPMPAEALNVADMLPHIASAHFSPHPSRQSSPSQSSSPSRTASPVQPLHKVYHNKIERGNAQVKSFVEQTHHEVKEVNQPDEISGLHDKKYPSNVITGIGPDEMIQLRSAVISLNGIIDDLPREYPTPFSGPPLTYDSEIPQYNVPGIPRHLTLDSNVVNSQSQSPLSTKMCCACPPSGPDIGFVNSQVYCVHNLDPLHLDHKGSRHYSSSSSDASSISHSPPSTPANQNCDKVYNDLCVQSERVSNMELSTDTMMDESEKNLAMPKLEKCRISGGRGRSRIVSPQGVHTLPRGRGPHSSIVGDNIYTVPSSRRDGPRSAPPTPHEEKKVYVTKEMYVPSAVVTQTTPSAMILPPVAQQPPPLPPPPPPPPQPVSVSANKPLSHDLITTGGVPYFLPSHYTPVYSTYATGGAGTFVRANFPFPNGDVMYQFPQAQHPFVPPSQPIVSCSANVPLPKVSCYNCSSQSHSASECKEPTMEDYTSKGQYRIDYKKYNKQGECLSDK